MSVTSPKAKSVARQEGIALLAGMVALMWVVELINSVDFLPGSRGTNLGAVASLTWIPSMAPFH